MGPKDAGDCATPPHPAAKRAGLGRPFVLVVEDEAPSAEALQEALLSANCDVELVDSAEEAVEALRNRFFSLAIVDMVLPRMNGR